MVMGVNDECQPGALLGKVSAVIGRVLLVHVSHMGHGDENRSPLRLGRCSCFLQRGHILHSLIRFCGQADEGYIHSLKGFHHIGRNARIHLFHAVGGVCRQDRAVQSSKIVRHVACRGAHHILLMVAQNEHVVGHLAHNRSHRQAVVCVGKRSSIQGVPGGDHHDLLSLRP